MRKLQDLPPRWARFCLEIQLFMEELLGKSIKGGKFLLAFSGGPDSLALLRVLGFIRPRAGIDVSAVHLNHMLRTEADDEKDFVLKICAGLGVPVIHGKSDVSSFARIRNIGIEEAARIIRYRFAGSAAARQKADYILTGHHLNDLAEDVLMRLARGAGWPGLSGMTGFDPERKLVRPFLLTPKKTILDFLAAINQEYMVDKSNADKSFLRNKVRLRIVPRFEEINPDFLKSVANLWRLGRIDEDHWECILRTTPGTDREEGKYFFPETLEPLSRATRLRLYKNMLDELGPGQALFENLLELDQLWLRGSGNKRVLFPGNKFARILKRGIMFGLNEAGPRDNGRRGRESVDNELGDEKDNHKKG